MKNLIGEILKCIDQVQGRSKSGADGAVTRGVKIKRAPKPMRWGAKLGNQGEI